MIKNFCIEGIDRLGKSTLINNLKNKLGYHQVIHYQKPELLDYYLKLQENADLFSNEIKKANALFDYQYRSFCQMFEMLNSNGCYILDRSHIGEAVYAGRYRGYSGEYVFDLEKNYKAVDNWFYRNTLLVLLTTSDFSFIQDDGLSFDFSKKEEEQQDFKNAFNRSVIQNKVMIDVSSNGGFKQPEDILKIVVDMCYNQSS
jgi:thymidylate kinase